MSLLTLSAGSADITPSESVPLAGMGGTPRQSQTIFSRLEANAALLKQDETKVLLISVDLLYAGAELTNAVRAHAETNGIASQNVIIVASHTHYAPATDTTKPLIGEPCARYIQFVVTKLKSLVDFVVREPGNIVTAVSTQIDTDLNINRRRRWPYPTLTSEGLKLRSTTVMAPNREGPRDHQIEFVRFVDQAGTVKGIFWKFACHPTGYPETADISAEYPGDVRESLRTTIGVNLPVLFFQGFTGDVRPNLLGAQSFWQRLQRIRQGPNFGTPTLEQWRDWRNQLVLRCQQGFSVQPTRLISGRLSCRSISLPLSDLLENPDVTEKVTGAKTLEITRLAFENDLELLLISAEVCSTYGNLFGTNNSWHIGYTNDVVGYLPTTDQILDGGYEPTGSLKVMGLPSPFKPGVESQILDAVSRLRTSIESVPV
jgi:hypothetical protein